MLSDLREAERKLQRAREDFYALQQSDFGSPTKTDSSEYLKVPTLRPIIDRTYELMTANTRR